MKSGRATDQRFSIAPKHGRKAEPAPSREAAPREAPHSTTHYSNTDADLMGRCLMRLPAGIEASADLISDLEQAITRAA